jgi:two-component system sensor histidine kinase BaeS
LAAYFIVWGLVFRESLRTLRIPVDQIERRTNGSQGNLSSENLSDFLNLRPDISLSIFDAEGHETIGFGGVRPTSRIGEGVAEVDDEPLLYVGRTIGSEVVVLSTPWRPTQDVLDKLALALMGLWPPTVAFVGLASWAASRRTFAVLKNLSQQARELSATTRDAKLGTSDDREITELTRDLNELLQRIHQEVARQEQFIADASHELRTPLAIIQGHLETSQTQDQSVSIALEEAKRLGRTVEMLLVTARSGARSAEPVDLEPIVAERLAAWSDRLFESGIEVEADLHPVASEVEDAEVRTLADNLFGNVLRHARGASLCRISLSYRSGKAVLTVEDNGAPVSDEVLKNATERFYKGSTHRSGEEAGSGIGLALCRRVAESRGGTLDVARSELGGFKVSVELPAA